MSSPLPLTFQPSTRSLPGLLFASQATVKAMTTDGAARYFAAWDKLSACFKQAASLTLDELTAGPQAAFEGGNVNRTNWTWQQFTHVLEDVAMDPQAFLHVGVAASNQIPPDNGAATVQTFALLSVAISADDQLYEVCLEVQALSSDLVRAVGTAAASTALFQIARAGARALWNSMRAVFQNSTTDASVLSDSATLVGATESATTEEMSSEVLSESAEIAALAEVDGVISTLGPIAVPVAILLGVVLLLGRLFRKKAVVITHELHLVNGNEGQSYWMIPGFDNSQLIQYPSLTSNTSIPVTQNYQATLPCMGAADLALAFQSDAFVAAMAIFKFTNTDHKNPPSHTLLLPELPVAPNHQIGYQLAFRPDAHGEVNTFVAPYQSSSNEVTVAVPALKSAGWKMMPAAVEPSGTAAQYVYTNQQDDMQTNITIAHSYSFTPSSGSDSPDTYAYRTTVLIQQQVLIFDE